MSDHIGYLVGGSVACRECGDRMTMNKCRLFRENIIPYRQTCHCCGKVMVVGGTPMLG